MKNYIIGAAVSAASLLGMQSCDVATIGGTPVPSDLHCEEDEVIGFVGLPDTLVCVHPDVLADPEATARFAERLVND